MIGVGNDGCYARSCMSQAVWAVSMCVVPSMLSRPVRGERRDQRVRGRRTWNTGGDEQLTRLPHGRQPSVEDSPERPLPRPPWAHPPSFTRSPNPHVT